MLFEVFNTIPERIAILGKLIAILCIFRYLGNGTSVPSRSMLRWDRRIQRRFKMAGIAVVYKSIYGHTRKYAEWISDALQGDLYDLEDFKPDHIARYDTIIYGGGLYAGGILGHSFIVQEFERLREKNLVLFTVGLAATEDRSIFAPLLHKNFSGEILETIQIFHLRGGIEYNKLGLRHKTMMAMLKAKVCRNKSGRTEEEALMLSTYGDSIDFSDQKSITPLTDHVRSLRNKEG